MYEIIAVHREPFSTSPRVYHLRSGETLSQMARRIHSLPEGWPRHDGDTICINGHVVPQALWGVVRPKATTVTEVTFHAPPMGGDGGGKQILGIVASIGLIALSGGVASGVYSALGGVGTLTAATGGKAALLARLAGTAVLIAGSAVLQALTPTPSRQRRDDDEDRTDLGSAAAQGNVLEPNAPLPRVIGTRRIFPPFVTEPLVYFDGDDEVVEGICALAGPHELTDIRIGEANVEDVQGLELETIEGWPGTTPLTLINRYGRTLNDGTPIRGHTVSDEDNNQLLSVTGDILDAIPQPKTVATRDGPDSFWIGIQFPQGLSRTGTESDLNDLMRVPFRLRMRKRGESSWVNLPELHYMAAQLGPIRATIKLTWRDSSVDTSSAASRGWVEARRRSEGQGIAPTTSAYLAGLHFYAGSGDNYISTSNPTTSGVTNVILGEHIAEYQLDRSTFPPGVYEVEIKRGYAFRNDEYDSAAYEIDGEVRDPFFYEGGSAERIHQTKNNLVDEVALVRYSSVWNDVPVRGGDVALIEFKARNVRADRISVLASGYVRDWNGSEWATWTTTSNPAPHLRDIFVGLLNATPLPEISIDNQSLLDWRSDNWDCNAVIEGQSVAEAAAILTGTGYAQFYQSEKFGVSRDYDRSAESPVQIFTPQNTANFSWSRGFPRLPDGFRATFSDVNSDYEVKQIIEPIGASRTEQVTIEGIVDEADVRARLRYDLEVAKKRAVFYSWEASAEAIKCRRGSLIGLATDALSTRVFTGRVADFTYGSLGNVNRIRLDNEASFNSEDTWADITDLSAVADMSLIGVTFGIAIRRKGQAVSTHAVTSSGLGPEWVELVSPVSAAITDLEEGDIATIGLLGQEYRRLIIVDMVPKGLTEWTITAVPEAPEIWQ